MGKYRVMHIGETYVIQSWEDKTWKKVGELHPRTSQATSNGLEKDRYDMSANRFGVKGLDYIKLPIPKYKSGKEKK